MDEFLASGLRFVQWIAFISTFCTTGARFNQRTDFTYNKINTVLSFYVITVMEVTFFVAMCLMGRGGVGGGQVYFLQLYVDLDGNHKNFKNNQNEKPQGKI